MITKLNLYKESILVPRNLEGRKDKLKQQNLKLLSQEIIGDDVTNMYGNLDIDESFDFDKSLYKFIKVKQINGSVKIKLDYIPEWLENVVINLDFYCGRNEITTLKGCPKKINGSFYCNNNLLQSLEYGPEFVGRDYTCYENGLTTLKGCPKRINGDFRCQFNILTSLEEGPDFVKGSYYCRYNKIEFTKEYIQSLCDVTGNIYN